MGSALDRTLGSVSRRLRLIAARAVIRLVNDGYKEQVVQVDLLSGETRAAERYQHYGFTSCPRPASEAIALAIGGSREHLVIVADGDRRYRLKNLESGEVALHDDQGQALIFKRGVEIHITGSDRVYITGALEVVGAVLSGTSVADPLGTMQEMRDYYNSHTHPGGGGPSPQMT